VQEVIDLGKGKKVLKLGEPSVFIPRTSTQHITIRSGCRWKSLVDILKANGDKENFCPYPVV